MATTLPKAIDDYLKRGFGSMNKNDFEVWIFNELLDSTLKGMSNYDISIYLRIPESKVKRLKYEATLKYGAPNDEALFKEQFKVLLQHAKIKNDGKNILFVIEDIQMRKHIDSLLKKDGRFADSSFNSEIVSVNIDDFEVILKKVYSAEEWAEFTEKLEEKLKGAKKSGNSFKEIAKKVFEKLPGKVIDLTLSGLLKLLFEMLSQ